MPRTNEIAFNVALSNVLRTKHPRWRDRTGAEQQGVVRETAQRPDIVIRPPGGIPVVLETEFEPARSVEEDARKRSRKWRSFSTKRMTSKLRDTIDNQTQSAGRTP